MKKYLKTGLFLFALGLSVVSCESTLDINESEVDATTDLVSPELLLAGAIQAPRARYEVTTSELGSILMQQWGGDINNVTGGFQDEFRLNFTQNFTPGSIIWRDLFRGMGTFQAIIDNPDSAFNNYKAISMINKSYYFQVLTDLYGNIPYSQALQFGLNISPAYDDAQSIYRDLIVQLDAAIAILENSGDYLPVGTEDTIFNGDANGWIQVANTLKLRILLRQSELAGTDAETATYLTEQFAALSTNFLTTDATLNPGYAAAAGQQNPFWNNYGTTATGEPTFDNDFIVPSDYMVKFLRGEATQDGVATGTLDPRLVRMYEPVGDPAEGSYTAGDINGVVQGATSGPEFSELGPGLRFSAEQDSYFFTAAESFFLQAEAAHKGYITGNAQALFHSGITASFNLLGATGAAAYIGSTENTNLVGWSGSSNKIEAIMTQKWIALCGINAIESFIDYNRTGFPAVPLSLIAEQSQLPYRMLYPASEYSTNSANVPNQPSSEAFSSKIFWDVN
ncbi:SusD/RagB family nutrient-binding outer membrane lipoprotein [Pontimicrobium sp. MEBiC06410]